MLTTDDNGGVLDLLSYTAFGDLVLSDGTVGGELPAGFPRYAYAGGYGYESSLITLYGPNPDLPPITLQHVGERWYQPGIGRFIQRDPIGLAGGLNLYGYVELNPLTSIDPDGLQILPGTEGLPRTPKGWIKIPPGMKPIYIPGKGWVLVPRAPPPALPRWKPAFRFTPRVGGAVCVAFAVGYAAGTIINETHPGTKDRYSDYIGRWMWKKFWRKPKGRFKIDIGSGRTVLD